MGDNVDANFHGKGAWYGGHITSINEDGDFDLQFADGDVELGVPRDRIRSQNFTVGDAVEVNCGGKGVWHAAEVIQTNCDGSKYEVKFKRPGIKWITDEEVAGVSKQKHSKCLSAYLLLGWVIVSRKDGKVIVRRPPQPLPPRGFAVTRRTTKGRILPIQVLTLTPNPNANPSPNPKNLNTQKKWLKKFWNGKSTKKQNVMVASHLMVRSIGVNCHLD